MLWGSGNMEWRRGAPWAAAAAFGFAALPALADCTVGANIYLNGTKAVYEERYIECRGDRWQYPIVGATTEWRSLAPPLAPARFRLFGEPPPPGTPRQGRIPLDPVQPNAVIIGPAPPSAAQSSPPTQPGGQAASSQSPPNTFEGAQNFGTLDVPVRSPGGVPYFNFHFSKHTINRANPYYTSKFYRFDITRETGRLRVHLQEEPQATLLLRLFDAQRRQIFESVGGTFERFEKDLPRGTYFLQSLRNDSTNCVPVQNHCLNYGRLSIEAFPVPAPSDAGGELGQARDLGDIAPGFTLQHRETLFRLYRRGAATADQGLRPVLPETEFDDYLDYFILRTGQPGRLYGSTTTAGLTLQMKVGEVWVNLTNQGVDLPPGSQYVRITNGTATGQIVIAPQGEFWLDYTLLLRFERR